MYNLPHFKADNQADVIAFMRAHPFITLCCVDASGCPIATHIPVLFEEREGILYLKAHIMRKQEHTLAMEKHPDVLVIFSGEHAYISASWYTKQNIASTWNYRAVHAKGVVRFLDDAGLYNILVNLTNHFERTSESPAAVKFMSEDYVKENMKAIVGFEIELTSIQHVFKLSQNNDDTSKQQIINHLGNDNLVG